MGDRLEWPFGTEMIFEKNYANQAGLLLARICSHVLLGKINGAQKDLIIKTISSSQQGGLFYERAELKTLKIISHRAARYPPFFIIIIMVINVYKLETRHRNRRTAGAKIQPGWGAHDVVGSRNMDMQRTDLLLKEGGCKISRIGTNFTHKEQVWRFVDSAHLEISTQE